MLLNKRGSYLRSALITSAQLLIPLRVQSSQMNVVTVPMPMGVARTAGCAQQRIRCCATRRRTTAALLLSALSAAPSSLVLSRPAAAAAAAPPTTTTISPAVLKAFQDAMAAQGDFEAMDRAWSKAVELAPDNAAAWSNRGTARLQAGRWQDAYDDLSHALELERRRFGGEGVSDGTSALLLNQLGNAEGALGKWEVRFEDW